MERRMYRGARAPSLAANSTPLFSATCMAVPGMCSGDGVAWIWRGQLESETFGAGGQVFLRLQCHCFPQAVSLTQQVPSAEDQGGQCHPAALRPPPLELVCPSQTCQSPS